MADRGERGGESGSPTGPLMLIGCAAFVLLLAGLGVGAFMFLAGGATRRPSVPATTIAVPPSTPPPRLPPAVSAPSPAPSAAPNAIPGALPADVIRRVVRAHIGQVQRCYEDRLATDPTLTARVMAHFTIAADGSVSEVSVDGSDDTILTTCIGAEVRSWTFPAPTGGGVVTVNYPFVFSAS